LYETGAPPPPPPLPVDPVVIVDQNAAELPPGAARVDHAANILLPPVRQDGRPSASSTGWNSVVAVLPAGPPPGTTTYRLRGSETSQDG
jgi:hypothetical protein